MIDATKVSNMVQHWLSTPPNGYYAQSYGADAKSMLLQELTSENADDFIQKLRRDIPLIGRMNEEQLSVSVEPVDFDKLNVILSIGNIDIQINDTPISDINQDYVNVIAK